MLRREFVRARAAHGGIAKLYMGLVQTWFSVIKDGTYSSELILKQVLPLELTDRAAFHLRVSRGNKDSFAITKVATDKGKVIIKQEQKPSLTNLISA